ncbi:hypothetical protein WBJ53_25340 [Spirosoma sp. SC4-14]|uniref:hypothetical protein n=1 Tax=Spirosoma sp. SC4-14 TaxID=3128900 RepID=UPI0030CE70E3
MSSLTYKEVSFVSRKMANAPRPSYRGVSAVTGAPEMGTQSTLSSRVACRPQPGNGNPNLPTRGVRIVDRDAHATCMIGPPNTPEC